MTSTVNKPLTPTSYKDLMGHDTNHNLITDGLSNLKNLRMVQPFNLKNDIH